MESPQSGHAFGLDKKTKIEEVVLKMSCRRGSDARRGLINVSPPHRGDAVLAPLSSGGPK